MHLQLETLFFVNLLECSIGRDLGALKEIRCKIRLHVSLWCKLAHLPASRAEPPASSGGRCGAWPSPAEKQQFPCNNRTDSRKEGQVK